MSDDLISRQAAIDAVEKKIRYTDHDEPVVDWNDFVAALCFLPSAQQEWLTGTWINHRNDDGHNIADCDQCGNAIQWFDGDEIPRYCCMCGADMRGEQE